MLISWSGRGLLVVVFVAFSFFITAFIMPDGYPQLWLSAACLLSGIITYFVGIKWNIYHRHIVQEGELAQGKPQYQKIAHNSHRLYWIPIQYIGVFFIIIGITFTVLYLVSLFR